MPTIDPAANTMRDLIARAEDLQPARVVDAAALLLVDAIAEGVTSPVAAFLDEYRSVPAQRRVPQLEGLAAVAQWAQARMVPRTFAATLDLQSARGLILQYVVAAPNCSSQDLALHLELAEETVSRVGKQLEQDGLVARQRAGKWRRWRVTRLGEETLRFAGVLDEA